VTLARLYSIFTIFAARPSSSIVQSPMPAASSALPIGEIQLTASGSKSSSSTPTTVYVSVRPFLSFTVTVAPKPMLFDCGSGGSTTDRSQNLFQFDHAFAVRVCCAKFLQFVAQMLRAARGDIISRARRQSRGRSFPSAALRRIDVFFNERPAHFNEYRSTVSFSVSDFVQPMSMFRHSARPEGRRFYWQINFFKCRTACEMSFAFEFPNPRTKP
jgi:hypothetical protein